MLDRKAVREFLEEDLGGTEIPNYKEKKRWIRIKKSAILK